MKDNVLPELVTRVNARKIVHAAITRGIQHAKDSEYSESIFNIAYGGKDDDTSYYNNIVPRDDSSENDVHVRPSYAWIFA